MLTGAVRSQQDSLSGERNGPPTCRMLSTDWRFRKTVLTALGAFRSTEASLPRRWEPVSMGFGTLDA